MPDPTIRLRLLVAPDGSATVSGIEQVVTPLKRAVKEASAQASKDIEGIGASVSKVMQRLRGFRIVDGKQEYTTLTDILKSLDSMDAKLGKLTGRGFSGLTKSFKELGVTLDGIGKQLDAIVQKMGAIGTGGPGGGSTTPAATKPLSVSQALKDKLNDVVRQSKPTGAMQAELDKNGDVLSLIAERALGAIRIQRNARTGSYRLSMPNTLERNEAIKALRASLAGATSLGAETLQRTGQGDITRELFQLATGQRAYLYPDAKNPYIRFMQGSTVDPAAQAAAQAKAFADSQKTNRDFLTGQGYTPYRTYNTSPTKMVEEWMKDGEITRHMIDALRQTSKVNIPAPRDTVAEAKQAQELADRNKVITDKLNSEGFAPTGKAFQEITEAGESVVKEFKNAAGAIATFDEKLGKLTVKTPEDNTKAVADAQAKAEKFLADNNFKEVSRRVNLTPEGERTSINYKNAAGATASYEKEVGKLNAALPKSATLAEKLGNAVIWVGKQFGSNIGSVGVSALEKLAHPFQTTISFMLKLGGAIYTVKNLMRGIEAVFVDPVVKGVKAIMDATEEYRQFELAIAGVVGGLGKAKEVNSALVDASRHLPLTVRELQEIARGMAYMGPLTSRIAMGNGAETAEAVGQFSKLVTKLAIYDPQQGAQGVMLAMRDAMSGELRSLRTRLEIPISQVAASINKTERDLADNPRLLLQALGKWTDQYIPDSALAQRGRLYSVQVEKLQGSLRHAASQIGDAGIFDKIVDSIGQLTDKLFGYLKSDDWVRKAQSISDHLGHIFTNIVNGLADGLRVLTGAKADEDIIKTVAGSIDWFVGKMDEFSKHIKDWIPIVIDVFKQLGQGIAELVGTIAEAAQSIQHPKDVLGTFGRSGASDIRETIARRQATSDLLAQLGMPNLRSEAGRQSVAGAYWSPGDRYIREHASFMDHSYFMEDIYAKATGSNDLRIPYYKYAGRSQEEIERIEAVVTRIENLVEHSALARTPDGGYLPRFLNVAGIGKLIEDRGEKPNVEWLQSAYRMIYPPAAPATQPSGPKEPVFNPRLPWYRQLPTEQLEKFDFTEYQKQHRDLIEFNADRFHGMLLKSVESAFGRLGQFYNPERSPFDKMLGAAPGVISDLSEKFTFGPDDYQGDVFEKARFMQKQLASTMAKWMEVAEWTTRNMPEAWRKQAQAFIDGIAKPTLEKLQDENTPMVKVAQALKENAVRFGLGLADQLEKVNPEVAAEFAQAVHDGTLGAQEDLKKKIKQSLGGIKLPDNFFDFGIGAMDPADRAHFMDTYFKIMERRFQTNSAELGQMATQPGVSGQELFNRSFTNPFMQMQGNREYLKFLEAHQGELIQQFDETKAKYQNAMDSGKSGAEVDQLKAALGQTAQAIDHLAQKMRELKISTNYALQGFIVFGQKVEEALENSVGDAIYNLITGTGTLKDALLSFARDVVRAFSQMAAHNIVASLLGTNSMAQGGQGVMTPLFMSLFGGGKTTTTTPAAVPNSANAMDSGIGTVGGNGTAFAATGAVWKGGFTPIMAFSAGGIVNRPVIGIVGEGKEPAEAMVPLPDGRSIPAKITGNIGGDTEVKVYVVSNMQEAVARGFKQNRDYLVDAIAGDVKRGGKVKKAMRRVAG